VTSDPSRPTRAMELVSVRFGAHQIELIKTEAAADGVSVSQFIRDAAYARAVMEAAQRNAKTMRLFRQMIAIIEEAGSDTLALELRETIMLNPADDERDNGRPAEDTEARARQRPDGEAA
jgi:uncharacterized protein (DUF1778 family)